MIVNTFWNGGMDEQGIQHCLLDGLVRDPCYGDSFLTYRLAKQEKK